MKARELRSGSATPDSAATTGTGSIGSSVNGVSHPVTSVEERLDAATRIGLLEGVGGCVPRPTYRAVNRGGELISETVSKSRE